MARAVAPSAHRLALSATEWALLVRQGGFRPPPGFEAVDPTGEQLREATSGLADRRVVTVDENDPAECRPVGPVATNLAVFAGARVLVQVEASFDGRWSRSAYAIAGPVGASLIAGTEGRVELSMFGSVTLGTELIRAIPAVREMASSASARLGQALGGGQPLSGSLPLAALADYAPAAALAGTEGQQRVVSALRLTPAQAWLAEQVNARTTGVLRAVVTGRVDDGLAVGQVVWLATDEGWLGVRPAPDGSGQRPVTIRPVDREEIGAWLAPFVARILDDADG